MWATMFGRHFWLPQSGVRDSFRLLTKDGHLALPLISLRDFPQTFLRYGVTSYVLPCKYVIYFPVNRLREVFAHLRDACR